MALYLVLRHRQAADQAYKNVWLDDGLIGAIETPSEIGELCSKAKDRGERVFVHRCGWEEIPPVVCCSAKVEEVCDGYKSNVFVTFTDAVVVEQSPPVTPVRGQNYYLA